MCLIATGGDALWAQKNTQNIISGEDIKEIIIDADEVHMINIIADDQSTIRFKTHSEGEYFENIGVDADVKNGQLFLRTRYPERLVGGYDKLSAHKVFSLEMTIRLPGNKIVSVASNSAAVVAKGNFKSLAADLQRGYCVLKPFQGNAMINTYNGNIKVYIKSGNIAAKSRHGKVVVPKALNGFEQIRLSSINGDITVVKTK